jgi:hypothetical protein
MVTLLQGSFTGWNWRFWRDMKIWSPCTKMFGRQTSKRESMFTNMGGFQCQYSYSQMYLGAKSKVIFAENQTEVLMSYSIKDGVLVKIKRNKPYRVLFEYIDGSYVVNDEIERGYAQLVETLNSIKNESSNNHHLKVYDSVEEIMYRFLEKFLG